MGRLNKNEPKDQKKQRPFIKEMAVEDSEPSKKRSGHGQRRLTIIAVGLILMVIFGVKNIRNYTSIASLNDELMVAQETLELSQNYQVELQESIHLLENEEYVANLARNEYYLTDDDEVVFNIVGDPHNFSIEMNKKQKEFEKQKESIIDSDQAKKAQD